MNKAKENCEENCFYRVPTFVFKTDFIVTDSEDIEYLKLRNVGREIQVELEQKVVVDVTCLCVYDILYLADQVVVFDLELCHTNSISEAIKLMINTNLANLMETNLADYQKIYNCVDAQKLLVYKYLRKTYNYCVTNGEALGVDFVMYEGSQSDFHAKYGVIVETDTSAMEDWYEMIMSLRNLGQVKKKLLFAKFEGESNYVKFVEIDRWDFETLETTFYTDKNRMKAPNKIKYPSNKKKARLEKIVREFDDSEWNVSENFGTSKVISEVSGLDQFDLSFEGIDMNLNGYKPDLSS
jgi:tRNA splicing endonuclease